MKHQKVRRLTLLREGRRRRSPAGEAKAMPPMHRRIFRSNAFLLLRVTYRFNPLAAAAPREYARVFADSKKMEKGRPTAGGGGGGGGTQQVVHV